MCDGGERTAFAVQGRKQLPKSNLTISSQRPSHLVTDILWLYIIRSIQIYDWHSKSPLLVFDLQLTIQILDLFLLTSFSALNRMVGGTNTYWWDSGIRKVTGLRDYSFGKAAMGFDHYASVVIVRRHLKFQNQSFKSNTAK